MTPQEHVALIATRKAKSEFHAVNGKKKCKRCHEVKPVAQFHRHKATVDKYAPNCRNCCREIAKKYYANSEKSGNAPLTARDVGYEPCDIKRGMALSNLRLWNENYEL